MKIVFFELGLKKSIVRTILGNMFNNLIEAISRQPGYEATFHKDPEEIKSDTDILVYHTGAEQEKKNSRALIRFKGPLILYTPPAYNWFNKKFINLWRENILFSYSTDASGFSQEKFAKLHIPHLHFPFASDPETFYPLPATPKIFDIAFVGNAQSGTGRYQYIDLLVQKAKKENWKILLLGKDWDKYDIPFQLVAHGSLLNLIYNSAKININIINNEQKLGKNKCLDSNNRLFDLAMSGVFQLANAPQVTENYFSQIEVPAFDDPQQWLKQIEYYLNHPEERQISAEAARKRALKDHAWNDRAVNFTDFIEKNIQPWTPPSVSLIKKIRRLCYVYSLEKNYKEGIKHPIKVAGEIINFLRN